MDDLDRPADEPQGAPAAASPAPDPNDTDASDADLNDEGPNDEGPNGEEGDGASDAARKRRRGSRGGQRRRKGSGGSDAGPSGGTTDSSDPSDRSGGHQGDDDPIRQPDELPEPLRATRTASVEGAERALVRKPQIGDTRPAPSPAPVANGGPAEPRGESGRDERGGGQQRRKRRRGGSGTGGGGGSARSGDEGGRDQDDGRGGDAARRQGEGKGKKRRGGRGGRSEQGAELDPALLEQRKGRERNGKPIGRYFMCVQVRAGMTQVAVLEGRNLIEHYVSRPADDISQIHGNIYLGKVQNVLPGMEAAFVDIATPKNAVLYRGDLQYDAEDLESTTKPENLRIEQILKPRQLMVCQVTKNPIGAKGARLTQEVSLPGRFVVLIPNSSTYGISKRLTDDTRKRLRGILDRVKPDQHGLIVRTAAEHATETELRADVTILLAQWERIDAAAKKAQRPTLLHREPELAVRVIREEFNADYRGVLIDDRRLYEEVREYVAAFNPELADRIEYYDSEAEGLALFERHHVHEQVHKALDRKVWLPSGGSLIIEHTEALSVIDVNTGKNVGTSNLEETVFHNNMEAAEEIAKQLRLRDIGGIIVIDFIDMEIKGNRAKVVEAFRSALARDKTRTQVFDISELGLVEMTRKRIGEGLLTEFSQHCPNCDGRGVVVDTALLD
ncbi:MAG: Rne/Rng family ribonuclease [Ilumatobacter sp.]|nr:MAG: Rne/Rng family ribonuclease [Ilumatobacter sp.]